QGDNWFVFHLLAAGDLQNVKKANAHFSEDLLATLLNEPIPGQGVFWSSVGGKPYPVPVRILSFETMIKRQEDSYRKPAIRTYAVELRERYAQLIAEARSEALNPEMHSTTTTDAGATRDVPRPTLITLDGTSDEEQADDSAGGGEAARHVD